ncbi:MAG: sulfur oxidation protein SoxY [Betaproteobacteria bacterium]|nr:sulfur oxidation protein SoxY [Betaproteobacteria bacterium]
MLQATAAGMALSLIPWRFAQASPEAMAQAVLTTFGDRPIREGRVLLELPKLAENGNVVPVTVTVDSPMTEQDHVVAIHLFSERNPLPNIVAVYLGPHNGRARVATRIRLAETQKVLAVARMNDDSLWSASVEVVTTITGCG